METITNILVGDWVDVFFEHCQPVINAKVTGIPYATGDSWKLLLNGDERFGTLPQVVYVQNFSKMERREPPAPKNKKRFNLTLI